MKLWNKEDNLDKKIEEFTVGNDRKYDMYIAKYDVIASIAHAKMLCKINILSDEESTKIINALNNIFKNIESENFNIENDFEDIHSKIESLLIDELGNIGKKIHTGRSRNDQVLVATQLFLKNEINEIKKLTVKLFNTLKKYFLGQVPLKEQDHSQSTYAKKINKTETQVDWGLSASLIEKKIRAFYPSPAMWFKYKGQRYKILKAKISNKQDVEGKIINLPLTVACSEQSLDILEIQAEGKKPLNICLLYTSPSPRDS